MAMRNEGRLRRVGPGSSANPVVIVAPAPAGDQRPPARPPRQPAEDAYGFLVPGLIDRAGLERAEVEASRCGVATHEVLLAAGSLSATAYASALAGRLGVASAGWDAAFDLTTAEAVDDLDSLGLSARVAGRPCRVLCAESKAPGALRRQVAGLKARGVEVALAPRFRIDAALTEHWSAARIDHAVRGLFRQTPASSAGGVMVWTWQLVAAAIAVGLIIGGLTAVPDATVAALAGMIALPFFCITLLRLVAFREAVLSWRTKSTQPARHRPAPAEQLPVYSVLVPLFREANVLSGLVRSLQALDYPPAKLEILLVLEAADIDTQAGVLALRLPPNFRTVMVPDRPPRTKPKALNYALQFSRGDYIVVYDAEDRPQPDQLRRALEAFRCHPPQLGCVQAQLNIYNPRASWFTRQFTVEYSALFDAILPALARLGLPVPLGGTSNHFPRETLVAAGGWDPFNVTEDADLGFRLARQGWRTAVLASTTWEEAPVSFGQWFRQRTRWLKGWMQTYLVHTRQPWRLNAELGLRGALGFHALMGGIVLSALVHPLFYLLLAYHAWSGELFAPAETLAGAAFWTIALINLAAGYVMSIAVGALSAWRRGQPRLALSALFMPVCWLLISAAAYRALYQLATAPYLWEKTEHGRVSRRRRRARRAARQRQ